MSEALESKVLIDEQEVVNLQTGTDEDELELGETENTVLDYGDYGQEMEFETNENPAAEAAADEEANVPDPEVEEAIREVETLGTVEDHTRINPMRMYDTRERQVSTEALQMVYAARDHRTVLKYPAVMVDEKDGEKCLIFYIPDVQTGVEGILPESKAGLRGRERLEDLMRYPYLRVIPEWIDRETGICILNRALATELEARRAWPKITEGMDVEGVVVGVRRVQVDKETRRPVYALLDIDGIPGIMRVSEVSHNFVVDVPYRRGDILKVRVIKKIEREVEVDGKREVRRRLEVSRRALELNPWLVERFIPKIGQECRGVITFKSKRYIHIMLPVGIEVLAIHPSLNYAGRDRLEVGTNVSVHIVYVDRERRYVRGNLSPTEAKYEIERFKRYARRKQQQA